MRSIDFKEVRHLLDAATIDTRGAVSVEWIEQEVRAGRVHLVGSPSGKSVAILQPIRDLHVIGVAGDMNEVMELERAISEKASGAGYDHLTTIPSREGWSRVLSPFGWRTETAIVKDLGQ